LDLKRPLIVGDFHIEITSKMRKIFYHQHIKAIKNGIKGFILYGIPGTGKSTIAKAVIYDTINVVNTKKELLDKYSDENFYLILNLADFARSKFGETENIIRDVFEKAMDCAKSLGTFYIIIMDDVDGMFPTRSYGKMDAWYLGHLNVLFTELDKIETDKVGVIMTTNRKDLLDDAVLSRLYPIEINSIDLETARELIQARCKELKLTSTDEESIYMRLKNKLETKIIENFSFRDVEKEIILYYVEVVK